VTRLACSSRAAGTSTVIFWLVAILVQYTSQMASIAPRAIDEAIDLDVLGQFACR
jgi:hypothetical protein